VRSKIRLYINTETVAMVKAPRDSGIAQWLEHYGIARYFSD